LRAFIRHSFSTDRKFSGTLKSLLGFYPRNISLYRMAFRHKSAAQNSPDLLNESNERLEFLGDAILGAIVAEHLFSTFPFEDEGFLTKLRSKVVSRHHLNTIARKMGIPQIMNMNDANFEGSSIYGNALEALIGSIYLDKGHKKTKEFILNRFFGFYVDLHELETVETDFKSRLTEWSQKEKQELEFKVLQDPHHSKDKGFHVGVVIGKSIVAEASHHSKKRAEQLAAEKAWGAITQKV
jgi:ribonuclease-3